MKTSYSQLTFSFSWGHRHWQQVAIKSSHHLSTDLWSNSSSVIYQLETLGHMQMLGWSFFFTFKWRQYSNIVLQIVHGH